MRSLIAVTIRPRMDSLAGSAIPASCVEKVSGKRASSTPSLTPNESSFEARNLCPDRGRATNHRFHRSRLYSRPRNPALSAAPFPIKINHKYRNHLDERVTVGLFEVRLERLS